MHYQAAKQLKVSQEEVEKSERVQDAEFDQAEEHFPQDESEKKMENWSSVLLRSGKKKNQALDLAFPNI